ncbi:MAG: hypothetical protein HZC51_14320 [Nitrospirae bacterium]|nr:hypothetical protein [Nitrospirota bacterium]
MGKPMRFALVAAAAGLLAVLSCAPAFADEAEAAAGGGDAAATACPACGREFDVGRHGQEGWTATCPSCGRDVECESEEEGGFTFGADAGFFSQYVVRGVSYTDGPVFQPYVWASYEGFTASVWGNLDMTSFNSWAGNFHELDYGLDYTGEAGIIEYSAGALYYSYPHFDGEDTAELYAGLVADVPLSPRLTVYYDCWRGDGFFGQFSVGHSFTLPVLAGCAASLDLSAQAGFGTKNFNVYTYGSDHTTVTDYALTAGLPVAVTENITVTPTISYSSLIDRTIRSKGGYNDNVIVGGVVSASF